MVKLSTSSMVRQRHISVRVKCKVPRMNLSIGRQSLWKFENNEVLEKFDYVFDHRNFKRGIYYLTHATIYFNDIMRKYRGIFHTGYFTNAYFSNGIFFCGIF
ncbi:GfV-C7-ORF3 [Ichnoviriform fumiferanae]|uniref:GfV-C7-ORF3 n=1 Tax=Ichnoviriform fumiferanae TaxID=419435 RepID=A2PZX0_9VIRU|nr:GfV-C7-ORF3 [Ichnoviriform fumiferanae]BAF45542.1 GfV-C7-ORF3 [Ichnoviriform fumiferanae]